MSKNIKRKLTIALNLFVGIMSWASWVFMAVLTIRGDTLASNGLPSLKWFTVLSNLLNGVVSFLYGIWLLQKAEITVSKKIWKLVSTSAVGLTFLTVMAFLGPMYGYGSMFRGSNFWFHLILPVCSIFSFVILEHGTKLSFSHTLFAPLCPAVYASGYLLNIFINGIGEWPESNDFYGFLTWGNRIGAVIGFTIIFVTWLIAVLLYITGKCRKPHTKIRTETDV